MSVEAMAIVLHHSRAVGTDKLVLIGIANHFGEDGAWPSLATLAKYAGGVTVRTVRRSLRALEETGELRSDVQAGGSPDLPEHLRPNRYWIEVCCPEECDGTAQHRMPGEHGYRSRRAAPTPTPTPEAGSPWGPGSPWEPTAELVAGDTQVRGDAHVTPPRASMSSPPRTSTSPKPSSEPSLEPPAAHSASAAPQQTALIGEETPVVPESVGTVANRITRQYQERVPMSKFPAVAAVVRRALAAGHKETEIVDALGRMAEDRRVVTVDALRIELEGPPEPRVLLTPKEQERQRLRAAWFASAAIAEEAGL